MSQFAKSTAVFSGLTLVSRITGLLRLMAFTYAIGVQRTMADAYNLAYVIPSMIYEVVLGGLLSAIFIPLLVREQERSGKTSAEAWRVANLLLGCVAAILAVASILAAVLAPQIIHVLTMLSKGQEAQAKQEMAAWFLQFFAPMMFFYGLNAVFMAVLNSHNVFAITAAAPILNNVVVIASLLAYSFGLIGATGIAIGQTAGIAAMALVQLPWLLKIGMPLRPRVNFRDPVFRSAVGLGIPIVVVALANLFGTGVRTNLLTTVLGGFTAYTICFQLIMMPYGIFAVSIATVLYPAMSRAAVDKERDSFVRTFSLGLRWTFFIMLPVAIGLTVLALPITRALFERRGGEFRYADSVFTADFLKYYAVSILPYSLVMFATRAFYSLKDTMTPASINIGGVILASVLSYVLLKPMGIGGVALAAGIAYLVTTILSLIMLRVRVGGIDGRAMLSSGWRIVAAAATMAVAVVAAEHYTRPEVAVIARGTRFPVRLPPNAASGTALLVRTDGDWERLRTELRLEPNMVPHMNFDRESVVLLVGPQSESTSTMELLSTDLATSANAAIMVTSVRVLSKTGIGATDIGTSPSYVLAKVSRTFSRVEPRFEIGASRQAGTTIGQLLSGQILRLVLLVLLAAAVYVITAWLLGAEELKSLFVRIFSRRRDPTNT
ncbi:MAG: murein biosynthesis integral membrane protein MurJ [Candidatus Sumerlaeaceae bacterium]